MGVGTPETTAGTGRAQSLSYVALVLTLVVALLYLYNGMRGHPMQWPSTALLIALCATSVSGFMQSAIVKRGLTVVALVFALAAIYGFIVR